MELRDYQKQLLSDLKQSLLKHRRVLLCSPCGTGKTVLFSSINEMAHKKGNSCAVIVHRRELLEQAMKYSCDDVFMAQTLVNHLNTQYPILIVDEAHHSSASTWRKIFDYYPNSYIIGFTATPCRLDGKPLGDIYEDLVTTHQIKWFIENHYLCEFDYYAPKTITPTKMKGSDFDQDDATDLLIENKIHGDILKYIDNRKTIIYCSSVKLSITLEKQLADNNIKAKHFDASTPVLERKNIISKFRNGEITCLLNVDLVGEGFDVPDCEVVMLLRPTMSTSLYLQQSMRCMRPNGNKRATIYDFVGNCYRHGLPDEDREWSLNSTVRVKNRSGEKDLLVRECEKCHRVYKGNGRECPYCHNLNGKTKKQIEQEEKEELERIEKIEHKKKRMEVGMCRDFGSLVRLAIQRGYKNPTWWARNIIMSRNNKKI